VRDEHVITRQGRPFALYAGLLDDLHAEKIKSIHTELLYTEWIKVKNDDRLFTIVRAVITLEDGREFSGIGDAGGSDEKKGTPGAETPVRMAETRAKARAMRDALNVGAGLLDDTSTAEEAADKPDVYDRVRTAAEKLPSVDDAPNTKKGGAAGLITAAQKKTLKELGATLWGISEDEAAQKLDGWVVDKKAKHVTQLSTAEGDMLIAGLENNIGAKIEKAAKEAKEVDDESGLGHTAATHVEEPSGVDLDDEDLEEIEAISSGTE
jgi:hypothetical protein